MIPPTKNGLPALACVSAMQKSIRRGMEREAMEFACELIHTSKAFHSMVCKRLEIISHEDIDTDVDPMIVPFVATCVEQAMKWYKPDKIGASRMAIGNAIRMMSRAAKSREGDHFQAAIGLRSQLEGFKPEIPDWANDQHTQKGRALGRGLSHFREEGTKLVPGPAEPDDYIEEAYRLWAIKAGATTRKTKTELFDGVDDDEEKREAMRTINRLLARADEAVTAGKPAVAAECLKQAGTILDLLKEARDAGQ